MAQQWVAPMLSEQGSDEIPDLGHVQTNDDAGDGGQQLGETVNFHNRYLVFFGFPLRGAVFFFAAGFAGALDAGFLAAGFPFAGALGGGAV